MSVGDRDKVNILLVDDQHSRLVGYESILGAPDRNLVRARSGSEALGRLMKDEFAVVLLETGMPDMDGFATAAMIRRRPQFETTPIIFVAAFHETDFDRLKGDELGAVDYVYVPVVPTVLRSKVAVFVELHRKRREVRKLDDALAQANSALARANGTPQAEKTRELGETNRRLERTNSDLADVNATLEAEVAERARLDDELREADRRKDGFLAMLAHELRNPIAPIVNAVEIMRRKPIDDGELSWCRDVIDRQARRLTRLVEDLLDVSRIAEGKIEIQREPLEIADVVKRATEIAGPLIDAKGGRLTVEQPGHPVRVEGDLVRLAQALGNLLENAAKRSDEGGQIRLVVEESAPDVDGGPEVVVRVRDAGVGIPAEAMPKIFEMFTQADGTAGHAPDGLGIGLALVRRLVEIHGGSVSARSDGAGTGGEFVVRLPTLPCGVGDVRPQFGGGGVAEPETAQRVLVADDNVDAAKSLAALLETSGNSVAVAYDGSEAIETANVFRPDIVLLDIGMPKLDGYDAARWIRAQAWARNVLLVALTGWGQEDVRGRAWEAGFDAHMVKPVDFAALTALFAKLPSRNRGALVETH